jgi:hypothetical protein
MANIKELDAITGEEITTELTEKQIADREAAEAKVQSALKAKEDATQAAKQSILDRLGITADEAALLLK